MLRPAIKTTIPYLAQRLGTSVSTIKRDLLALTVEERYPIDTIPGNCGGVVMKAYRHEYTRILSLDQIKVLNEVIPLASITQYQAEVLQGILSAYS
jgi:predicted DNA-binding transcriptional regulator YafY